MRIPRFLRLLAPAALVAASSLSSACGRKAPPSAEGSERKVDPVRVSTTAVREAPMPVTMKLTGALRADRQARLAASGAGRVVKINVDRGSEVKQGDVLAELDVSSASLSAAEAQKAVQSAKVQRESAKRECERAKMLFENGAISKSELDLRNTSCQSADLGVEAAGLRVALGAQAIRDASVRAPFAGVVEQRSTDVGEYLLPGSPVATVVAIDKLRLEIFVPEAQLAQVTRDKSVTFHVAAYPGRSFVASVGVVGATVRDGTRDVLVEASVENADRALKPGMFAIVELVTSEQASPVVPKAAIVQRGDASHIFVVVDGRAHERIVKLGPERGQDVAVVRGATVGDQVVASPPDNLLNGSAVEGS
ncbi:MAG: efflux RND transporter periplasmic adaptor subunit [Polyangiaceae bacterium]|nr:efflux RND transporter periplasmic adaptor subunit [Polyangiaceae bacterium]